MASKIAMVGVATAGVLGLAGGIAHLYCPFADTGPFAKRDQLQQQAIADWKRDQSPAASGREPARAAPPQVR